MRPLTTADVADEFKKPRISQRPWFKPAIGVALLAFILLWAPVLGLLTSPGKISPDVDRTAAQVDIEVKMPFEPEQFHRETLSELGVFAGRDRDDPTILRLRAVTQSNLDRISRFFWVESIGPS